jgi:hypothetical protein
VPDSRPAGTGPLSTWYPPGAIRALVALTCAPVRSLSR